MDHATIGAYDRGAHEYAADWEESQSAPDDLRAMVRQFFMPGLTVDVGCGSGRDTAWLVDNGFEAHGVDASAGLIAEARRRHPHVRFEYDRLPELESLSGASFTNVLCETVIMHLEVSMIDVAVRRLVSLLAANGTLYLTWRVTDGSNQRDAAGRLYSSFDRSAIDDALAGTAIKFDERSVSTSSGRIVHRIVARRI